VVEHQGLALPVGEHGVHLQQNQEVIPGLDLTVDGAVEPGGGVVDENGALASMLPFNLPEAVALACQGAADLVLVVGEDADTEPQHLPQARPGGRGLLDADRDQRRVDRDRSERAGGDPRWLPAVKRAQCRDPAGKARVDVPELDWIRRHRT
jgi:hypothetical protein